MDEIGLDKLSLICMKINHEMENKQPGFAAGNVEFTADVISLVLLHVHYLQVMVGRKIFLQETRNGSVSSQLSIINFFGYPFLGIFIVRNSARVPESHAFSAAESQISDWAQNYGNLCTDHFESVVVQIVFLPGH